MSTGRAPRQSSLAGSRESEADGGQPGRAAGEEPAVEGKLSPSCRMDRPIFQRIVNDPIGVAGAEHDGAESADDSERTRELLENTRANQLRMRHNRLSRSDEAGPKEPELFTAKPGIRRTVVFAPQPRRLRAQSAVGTHVSCSRLRIEERQDTSRAGKGVDGVSQKALLALTDRSMGRRSARSV